MNPVVVRQLYRSLLKSVAPFCQDAQSDRMMCDRYAEYLPQLSGGIQPNDTARTLLRKSFDYKHTIPKAFVTALNKGFALLRDVNENVLELEVSRRWIAITNLLDADHSSTASRDTALDSLIEGLALISATYSLSTRATPTKHPTDVQKKIDEAKALFNARTESVHQFLETSEILKNAESVCVDDAARALSSIGSFLIDDCAFQLSHNAAEDFCIGIALQTKRVSPLILYTVVAAALQRHHGWQADVINTDSPPEMLRVYPKLSRASKDVQKTTEKSDGPKGTYTAAKSKQKTDPLFFSLLHGVDRSGRKAIKKRNKTADMSEASDAPGSVEGETETPPNPQPFILNLEEVVDVLHKRRSSFSRASLQRAATSKTSTELCVLRQALKLMLYQLRVSPHASRSGEEEEDEYDSDDDDEEEVEDESESESTAVSRFDGRRRAAAMCRKQLLMLLTIQ